MRFPARTVAALAGVSLVGSLVVVGGAAAGSTARGPVEDAREAARRVPFSARVEVSWVDKGEVHTAQVGVRAVGGSIRVQGPAGDTGAAGDGLSSGSPMVIQASAVTPATGAGDLLAPELEQKYDVERSEGPLVAGRPTEQFVLRSGDAVRERLAIDTETGLVLRREVLGSDGEAVRIVTVLQLDTAPVPEADDEGTTGTTSAPMTVKVEKLPSAYRAPADLAGGYRRVGAYRRDRLVHLLYTDGLHGMSLFSQPGTVSGGSLPPGGKAVRVGSSSGVQYTWPGGDVVTWQVGPVVHTLVGDGTSADLLAAARSLPPPAEPSVLSRLRGTARLVTELVSGGR